MELQGWPLFSIPGHVTLKTRIKARQDNENQPWRRQHEPLDNLTPSRHSSLTTGRPTITAAVKPVHKKISVMKTSKTKKKTKKLKVDGGNGYLESVQVVSADGPIILNWNAYLEAARTRSCSPFFALVSSMSRGEGGLDKEKLRSKQRSACRETYNLASQVS